MEILLAEDNATLREGLTVLLESEGYTVRAVADGVAALEQFERRRPDLLLLDVMMPKRNGYVVCRTVREIDKSIPIVFLTAKDGDADELRGISLGADDYISKTSSQEVMLARIASLLARLRRALDPLPEEMAFTFGTWRVDVTRPCLVSPAGRCVDLLVRELEMLRYFKQHPGELMSRDFLLTRFWGLDFKGDESTLSMAISRLRKKLDADGVRIRSVYGQGYRFE